MKEKGIDLFLSAATIIKSKYPNVIFHVCGFCEEEYVDKLNRYQEQNIIYYHGMLSNVKDFLVNVHCLVHPSYYPEGMSNILLEASAIGRPVITTNRSGCREIVENNITGLIFENTSNETDLVNKIKYFLGLSFEEKEAMGKRAREKVSREFDRQIIVSEYLELIETI
jgi:glycosyltransferase involved in cell wall biosynthesis